MLHSEATFLSDPPTNFDGQFFWDWLNMVFQEATGRPIQFSDIDAHVEIGGNHLIFETKTEGVLVPGGQKQALLQLFARSTRPNWDGHGDEVAAAVEEVA